MSDINLQQIGQVIGAIGSIFQRPTPGTAPTYGSNVPTYGQPQPVQYQQPYQASVMPDSYQLGGGGGPVDQVRSVYQQLLRRQPSDFEVQSGVESIRYSGYQSFVDELRRRNGLGAGPAPQQYQQPQPVYQQPQPVYQQPQPVYRQPQPVYQQPQPVYQQPAAGPGTSLPMGPLPVFR